jgi:hypothetical protein
MCLRFINIQYGKFTFSKTDFVFLVLKLEWIYLKLGIKTLSLLKRCFFSILTLKLDINFKIKIKRLKKANTLIIFLTLT